MKLPSLFLLTGSTLHTVPRRGLLQGASSVALLGMTGSANAQEIKVGGITRLGKEDIMAQKAHGTTERPVQTNLRWNVDRSNADRICSYNRHYAEYAGYWKSKEVTFLKEAANANSELTYYDSVSGKPLFVAPRGRTMEAFLQESNSHGWPSFRNEEVVWENVRILSDGEAVSVDGTHLGHNLPDRSGNRYCINLVSVAGRPEGEGVEKEELRRA